MTLRRVLGLADHVSSASSNFAILVLGSHQLQTEPFGVFSLVLAAGLVVITAIRAYAAEPLLLSDGLGASTAPIVSAVALKVGGMVSVLTGVTALVAPTEFRDPLLVLTVFAPILGLQDTLRFVAFADGREHQALTSDCTWLACTFGLAMADLLEPTPFALLLYWCIGALLGAVLLVKPSWRLSGSTTLRAYHRQWKGVVVPGVVESFLRSSGPYLNLYVIGALGGAAMAGRFNYVLLPFRPLFLMLTGVLGYGLAVIVEAERRCRFSAGRLCMLALPVVGLSLAVAGLASSMTEELVVIFGAEWTAGSGSLWAMSVAVAAGGIGTIFGVLQRARGLLAASAAVQVFDLIAQAIGLMVGYVVADLPGAFGGLAAARLAALLCRTCSLARQARADERQGPWLHAAA